MGQIDNQQIDHLAKLARLGITDKEKEKYSKQLSDILDYVKKIQKITKEADNSYRATDLENVFREDKVYVCKISPEELLKNVPNQKDGYIKIPGVFEEF